MAKKKKLIIQNGSVLNKTMKYDALSRIIDCADSWSLKIIQQKLRIMKMDWDEKKLGKIVLKC